MSRSDLAPAVRVLLHEGWDLGTLAFFHAMPDEEIRAMLPVMARCWTPDEMEGLRRKAKRQKRVLDIEDGTFYNHQRLLYKDTSLLEKKLGGMPGAISEAGTSMVVARKAMPRVTWKTRLQKAMANAPDDQHRARAEEKERQRWIGELMKLLEDAGFLDSIVRDPEAVKQLAARVAAGRRASTLRQHVKYGRRLQVYMESIYGSNWLRGPGDFIGYVALLLCGRSVPGSLFKCIAFIETAAEVSPEKRFSGAQSIHNYLKEVEQGNTWAPRQRTKAARLPVEVARAWEIGVLDVTLQAFKRVYCWYKLVKLWSALRSHDCQGVPPTSLSFDPIVGLQGEIVRAKTTGVGRRVEVVQFFVSANAWLVHEDWLKVGLQLFMTMNRSVGMENSSCASPTRT